MTSRDSFSEFIFRIFAVQRGFSPRYRRMTIERSRKDNGEHRVFNHRSFIRIRSVFVVGTFLKLTARYIFPSKLLPIVANLLDRQFLLTCRLTGCIFIRRTCNLLYRRIRGREDSEFEQMLDARAVFSFYKLF